MSNTDLDDRVAALEADVATLKTTPAAAVSSDVGTLADLAGRLTKLETEVFPPVVVDPATVAATDAAIADATATN